MQKVKKINKNAHASVEIERLPAEERSTKAKKVTVQERYFAKLNTGEICLTAGTIKSNNNRNQETHNCYVNGEG